MGKRIPTGKTYQFKTVEEIVSQLSAEQIDDFMIDFTSWLKFAKTGKSGNKNFDKVASDMQEVVRSLAQLEGEDPDKALLLSSQVFLWIDDGAHNKKIRIGSHDDDGNFQDGVVITVPEEKV